MAFGKFWKGNEPFASTVSHDFESPEEFRLKTIEETEKMHKCNHFHWRGVPNSIIGYQECVYWEFF